MNEVYVTIVLYSMNSYHSSHAQILTFVHHIFTLYLLYTILYTYTVSITTYTFISLSYTYTILTKPTLTLYTTILLIQVIGEPLFLKLLEDIEMLDSLITPPDIERIQVGV